MGSVLELRSLLCKVHTEVVFSGWMWAFEAFAQLRGQGEAHGVFFPGEEIVPPRAALDAQVPKCAG